MFVLSLEEVSGSPAACLLTHSRRFSLAAPSPMLIPRPIPGLVACPQAKQWEETEVQPNSVENNLFPLGCYCSAPSCCSCPGSRLAQPPPPAWLMGPGWKPSRPHPSPPPHAPLVTARFLPALAFQNQARRRGRGSLCALPGVLRGGEVGGMGPRCAPPHPKSPAMPSPPRLGTQQELGPALGPAFHELELWFGDPQATQPHAGRWLQVSSCHKTQLVPPQRGGTSLLGAPGQKQRPHRCCSHKRASTPPAQPQLSAPSSTQQLRAPKGGRLRASAPGSSWELGGSARLLRLPWCTAQ